jgi:SAM-dependent methyltransferase
VSVVAQRPPAWAEVFEEALRGEECRLHGRTRRPLPVPVREWRRPPDASDHALLEHCTEATIDVGCGPGRMAHGLVLTRKWAVGIDVVPEAVAQTRARGVLALRLDVFDRVPGEGMWGSALLADGNIGIGGDPVRLLGRVGQLLSDTGRVVVDVEPPGAGVTTRRLRIECRGRHSEEFPWTWVGADAVAGLATEAGFVRSAVHEHEGRWFAVLSGRRRVTRKVTSGA